MFVKTQFDTIVNIAKYDKINIEICVKSGNCITEAVCEEKHAGPLSKEESGIISKCEPLAQFPQDKIHQAKVAYDDLFSAILSKETAFDMTHYTS
ncbi:hypothetical protein J4G08_19660 [Candidatus Poribacteria bacterium]|nr:hypothetical protein [Candidatus Poribacteria bacterium]